ncbi:MAG: hypothetical protein AB1656_13955 [Candidatus Omnitrophota bacterium]
MSGKEEKNAKNNKEEKHLIKNNQEEKEEKSISEKDAEIVKNLPPQIREFFLSITSSKQSAISHTDVFANKLAEKMTEQHIDKILDSVREDNERQFRYANNQRNYNLIYVIISLLLFVFLTVYLVRDSAEIYYKILEIIALVFGGIGIGQLIKK